MIRRHRGRLARILVVGCVPFWLLTMEACGPGRLSGGIVGDPCFNGSYELASPVRVISVTVVHDGGAIALSGFNSRPDAAVPWELVSFSGTIESDGRASGDATVWFPRSDGLPVTRDGIGQAVVLLSSAAECALRTGLTLSIRYPDPSGTVFREMHTFTRL